MKNRKTIIVALATLLVGGGAYWLQAGQQPVGKAQEKEHEEHGHEESGHKEGADTAEISQEAIKSAGVEIAEAGAATISETISLSGKIALNQNKTALVKARFPGIVRSVKKSQGDNVTAGETLATVESNESLQVYAITAPLSGVIISRNISVGDTANEQELFTITDMGDLWVELHVFPQDAANVKPGQEVTISGTEAGQGQKTNISALLPVAEASTQTLLARATLKNPDTVWLPGISVRGDVAVSTKDVEVAVKTLAIQRMENEEVVFIQEGDHYTARHIKTGASDSEWTEVTEGIKPGEKYAAQGSFIIKAEIGKSEAEHSH